MKFFSVFKYLFFFFFGRPCIVFIYCSGYEISFYISLLIKCPVGARYKAVNKTERAKIKKTPSHAIYSPVGRRRDYSIVFEYLTSAKNFASEKVLPVFLPNKT